MNRFWISGVALVAATTLAWAEAATQPSSSPAAAAATEPATRQSVDASAPLVPGNVELNTQRQRVGYLLGMKVASDIRKQGFDIDPATFTAAINDAFNNRPPRLSQAQLAETIAAIRREVEEKRTASNAAQAGLASKNLKAGQEFLAANAKKEGIVVLPSGLQYRIIKTGTGKQPTLTDTVLANYKGSLVDGTVFDSSEKNGGPVEFPVSGVIPGWTEALQKMHEGDHWQVFIPASLAYGENGPPPIGPNSTLIFDMELVHVK